jgi:hypothetical protein
MLETLLCGAAPVANWTCLARGIPRHADQGAQFHEGLIPSAGIAPVEQSVSVLLNIQ